MFFGKDKSFISIFQIRCTKIGTRHKKFDIFTLKLHPLCPLKGGMFLSFSLSSPCRFLGYQPDKSLISVIDNVCYVYHRCFFFIQYTENQLFKEKLKAITITNLMLTITNLMLFRVATITNLMFLITKFYFCDKKYYLCSMN